MEEILKRMKERTEMLRKAVARAEHDYGKYPEGHLRVSYSNNRPRYYLMTKPCEANGKFIKKSERGLAEKLAMKDYNEDFLKEAVAELGILEETIGLLSKTNAEKIYSDMSVYRQKLITPYILTDELYAKEWQEKPFQAGPMIPEGKVYDTDKGEMVRSKSEAIIANMLFELGIPYHYEKPLRLKGGQVRYPDFTLLHVRERKEIYLEHFGLLDDEEYRRESLKKMNEYMTNGIYPGKNLIFTYETKETPLNIKGIRGMLKELML